MWNFPDPRDPALDAELDDLVALGADLAPETLVAAYRLGLFPMPEGRRLGWWCPVERGVLPLDGLRMSRSLRQACAHVEIRVDSAFEAVMAGCASPDRSGGWIDDSITAAYTELHRLGFAHSVEAWSDGELVGGLYGVSVDGLFAGESMFHRRRDASKVALVALVDLLDDGMPGRLLDVQWETPHLASLGVVSIPRADYLRRLDAALGLPAPRFTPPADWPPSR
ncbi:leucyl/phenylalanyl-tRNA--protein transferase [Nocardioides mangrovicus]|uniref:leucyl/phenylalanyl-tRNA--protein transferase n=1 Tax=Nocardioides mangrovicus TaxID=2478913 RepID=UPI001E429AF4|nr:leucyl/phenylalanyl-tRNA--protein transferase [Nocardioides mangrovicus]